MKQIRYSVFTAILMLLLSACTLTFRPGQSTGVWQGDSSVFDFGNAVTSFSPLRGAGAAYYIGDPIGFQINTTRAGYVTLTVRNPDGTVDVFSRNRPVQAGTTVINGTEQGLFSVTYPRGPHSVRVSLTPYPTDGSVRYRGRYNEDIWTRNIITDITPYPASERGYAETTFYVY